MRAFVFADSQDNRYAAGRTLRAFGGRGICIADVSGEPAERLAALFSAVPGPIPLLRAGAWPVDADRLSLPPPSATGLPLCALGAVRAEPVPGRAPHDAVERWRAIHYQTGGNFVLREHITPLLHSVTSLYLEQPCVQSLCRRLAEGRELATAIHEELTGPGRRVVHYAPLDVHFDAALRIVQLVTSLQQGGAERIALDLHRTLTHYGFRSLVISMGSPTRAAFAIPPETVDLPPPIWFMPISCTEPTSHRFQPAVCRSY
jgi:hypothetical protein